MLKAAALHGSPGALLVSRRSHVHTGTFARHGKCEARAPRSPNDAHVRRPAPRPLSRRSTCRVRAAAPRVHEARRYAALHAPRAPHLKHALRAARPRASRARRAGARSARAPSRARGARRGAERVETRPSAEAFRARARPSGELSPRSRAPARSRARGSAAYARERARARRSARATLAQTLDDGRVTVASATIFCRARRRACAPTTTLRTRPPSYSDFNQSVLAARRGGCTKHLWT